MTGTRGTARPDAPEPPTGRVALHAPPRITPTEGYSGVLMNALPMLGSLGSVALVASMGGAAGGRGYVAAGMFLAATLGFVVVQVDRQHRQRSQRSAVSRGEYLRHLADARQRVRRAAGQQQHALIWHHPDPASLPGLVAEGSRVGERSDADHRFLQVRYGLGAQPLSLELIEPEATPLEQEDPVAASALRRLLAAQRLQPGLPATLDLRSHDRVELCGPAAPARSLARAILCSASALHAPEHLLVAVVAGDHHLGSWDWLKWLPHAWSCRGDDAVGPLRTASGSVDDLTALLPAAADQAPGRSAPHLLLVTDRVEGTPDERRGWLDRLRHLEGLHGVTVLDLPAQWEEPETGPVLRIEVHAVPGDGLGSRPATVWTGEGPVPIEADQCSLVVAEAVARRLSPVRPGAAGNAPPAAGDPATTDYLDLLGLEELPDPEAASGRRPRPERDLLRVPIGLSAGGSPVHLDLKESAQHGMGPHGLVVGATGSGKSELLRTLVLGLALTHSADELNLVLVDFKGGATFAGLSALPHVSALITNLAQELTLVDRMQDALTGELVRRQELLRRAGDLASIRDLERARAAGEDVPVMPSLLVVVDEFAELLSARPEFVDLFVAIGRLGRSLGLHLLLASQRLDEGRLRGLEAHLSYRVGLRTFSAQESRTVLGVPDAYQLPALPGVGYLRSGPDDPVRFRAAYVSGAPAASRQARDPDDWSVLPFTLGEVRRPGAAAGTSITTRPTPAGRPASSLLDVAVGRLAGHGPAAHPVWLPPLAEPDTLGGLLGDLAADPVLGLVSHRWRGRGRLVVPLGTVDRPREQRRDPLVADLGGAAGHVAVVGGQRSGKSTLLRTLVAGLSLTTTPLECQFFVLDFGGGTFAGLAGLPHVSGIGTRSQPDVVRRIVAQVAGVVDRREGYFREHGIDSMEAYRARRAAGLADDGYGDVLLVVDGWGTLRADFDEVEADLQHLATRGLGFGVHLLAGATRWSDFRAGVRDLFGTRLELRLGDPSESDIDRRAAALVPTGRPGRGLLPGSLQFLAAIPRLGPGPGTLGEGLETLVERVAAAWPGPVGPRLRLLPERVELATVRELAGADREVLGRHLLLGVDERELAPVSLDPDAEPHLLVLGEGRSGKTTLLRSYLREVLRTRTPQEAQLLVVDYRRSLLGEVPDPYLLDFAASADGAQPALRHLAAYLEDRLPGPDVTAGQLRDRSWWRGAEVFVLVDDYELVATAQGSPVAALVPLLARARETGLHLAVARHSGGAARAWYEPVIQSLRDLAAPGVVLSGSAEEGPLLGGVRPGTAPPGRGRLVTRQRGVEVVQAAWSERRP